MLFSHKKCIAQAGKVRRSGCCDAAKDYLSGRPSDDRFDLELRLAEEPSIDEELAPQKTCV